MDLGLVTTIPYFTCLNVMTLILEQTCWAQINIDAEATLGNNINGYFAKLWQKQTTKFKLIFLTHVWIADRG